MDDRPSDGRIYLVRHAKAGSRDGWEGDDVDRPLTKNGWKQARAIAERLAAEQPPALLTSPYVRCRQTLEPLGELIGVEVVADARLAEGGPFGPVVELLAAVDAGAVLCSHGDIVPDTITALQRRGCEIAGPADWRKATVWTIERVDGSFVRATVEPPPAV